MSRNKETGCSPPPKSSGELVIEAVIAQAEAREVADRSSELLDRAHLLAQQLLEHLDRIMIAPHGNNSDE